MLSDPQIQNFTYGIAAFVFIVSAHIILLHGLSALFRLRPVGEFSKGRFAAEIRFVLQVIAGLFAISLATNLMWGGFIAAMGVVPAYRNAVFYALENYTSLGLTRVQVDPQWRTLAPLISLSGVFCLAWSTAILVTVFNHVYALKRTGREHV
jgi:hypothetical protein